MTLYDIMKGNYGMTGNTAYQKQKSIYEGLGSPLGAYKGSAAQNIWLLNNKSKWLNVQPQQAQQAQPAQPATPAQDPIVVSITAPINAGATPNTDFNKVLNYNDFVNNPLINKLSTEKFTPEYTRNSYMGLQDARVNQSKNGTFGSGVATADLGNLADQYKQQLANTIYNADTQTKDQLTRDYGLLRDQYAQDANNYVAPDINNILNQRYGK